MKTNETKKIKKIFTRRLALELRKRGFDIVATEPNPNKPQFDVYLFEDTPSFQKALSDINNIA